ncbi:3-oxoacyl-ACP synthase III family protein [Streptomyces mobaraensis]|uniref:3-oxoacyl-ACP synthase n=1 Tax=Streptomyces mobaraensis TaxID=35621 RepID=A0A5N5W029_STRMB|nr:3-oxoacyl-[acyl-carrier-protein] synthase III C-terminal domain-containing protein [Streptomyces mobaraensis]KAB7834676.1 3-oxoacyl-ACP synthase [Streptomyces mobaraensis]
MQPDGTVGIVDFGSYLPENVVGPEFFRDPDAPVDPLAEIPLFKVPATRHHVARDERAADMIAKAARPVFERLGVDPAGRVDVLLTNVLLPDEAFMGVGAQAAHRLGISPEWIVDLHNAGCGSFMYMMALAQKIMAGGGARTALVANVQNTAGQVFAQSEVRRQPHAAVPGDGCGVAYLEAGGGSPILGVRTLNVPEHSFDLGLRTPDGRKYWEPGGGQMGIAFDPARQTEILERGNRLVPELVGKLCADLGVATDAVDVLVTNQPNRIFLKNWRGALGIPEERHLDTFDRYGNLYGAAVPITLDRAAREGRLRDGDLVVMSGFAHAGDFASAAAVRWRGGAGRADGAGGAGRAGGASSSAGSPADSPDSPGAA